MLKYFWIILVLILIGGIIFLFTTSFISKIQNAFGQEKPILQPPPQPPIIPEPPKSIDTLGLHPVSPVSPSVEEKKTIPKIDLQSPNQIQPSPEGKKDISKPVLNETQSVSPNEERRPVYQSQQLNQIEGFQPTNENRPQVTKLDLNAPSPVQGVDGENYQVQQFADFTGGLNLVSTKTKLKPNEALVLENALWNPAGEMYKRPGYTNCTPGVTDINFLYRYYQQDGDKYTMIGTDTALYFSKSDSCVAHYLIGMNGVTGRWDGTTFNDLFIGTHEGIIPVIWNGDTLISIGVTTDSFQIMDVGICQVPCVNPTVPCSTALYKLSFSPITAGWTTDQWVAYTVSVPFAINADDDSGNYRDTVSRNFMVYDNGADWLLVTEPGCICTGKPAEGGYVKFLSLFGVDTVWREGIVDSVISCSVGKNIRDNSYTWDSSFAYNDYIFEVIGGAGQGFKDYLFEPHYCAAPGAFVWNTNYLPIPSLYNTCLDSTSHYRIYKPTFMAKGGKFVEVFDNRVFIGWTGLGSEQNKNRIIWSALKDVGNFPPENNYYLTPGDGDYITGLYSMQASYVDVPRNELIVSKNNSLYKMTPTATVGDYMAYTISNGIGCVSNSAMSSGGGLFLFPDQNGVWVYDGTGSPKSISQKIKPVFDSLDKTTLENISGIYNPEDRHYYISLPAVPCGTTTEQEQVYDIGWSGSEDGVPWDNYITEYTGTNKDSTVRINPTDSSHFQTYIAIDSAGRVVVLYQDNDSPTRQQWVIQRLNSDLSNYNGSFWVNTVNADSVMYSRGYLDVNNNGRTLVTWWRYGATNLLNGAYFKLYDSWNDTVGTELRADSNTTASWVWGSPDGALFDDNSFVVCWRLNTTPKRILFALFDSLGNRTSPDVVVDDSCLNPQIDINHASNTFIITYERQTPTGGSYPDQIYASRFNKDGTPIGSHFRVDDEIGYDRNTLNSAIDMSDNGKFTICWTQAKYEDSSWSDYLVYCQQFDSSASQVGNDIHVTDDRSIVTGATYWLGGVYTLEDGKFAVTWQDGGDSAWLHDQWSQPGDSLWLFVSQIRWRLFDTDGSPLSSSICVCDSILHGTNDGVCFCGVPIDRPNIDGRVLSIVDTVSGCIDNVTYAWNIDYHGWSKESFFASAYCYQHSIFDSTKILFADSSHVNAYGESQDDNGSPVILTYQTGYYEASQYPSYYTDLRYTTVEAYGDTGIIYLDWFKNYGDSVYSNTVTCGDHCRTEFELPDSVRSYNIGMKLRTGSGWDEFLLSRFWWEYKIEQRRRK